ncbi:M12 family metallopeptidase [Archangium violaceum]|uniref:M12 family metallopeptidase n=1 Tax=Archangium violaceum TaxID=83451 RepID=UPI0037C0D12F
MNPFHGAAGYLLPATLILALAPGCNGSTPLDAEAPAPAASLESSWVPAEAPIRTAHLRVGASNKVRELHYAEVDGLAVFEGDIILGKAAELRERPGDVQAQGVSISGVGYLWTNAIVPYTLEANLPNAQRVTDAIRHWQDRTNVRFVPRTADNAQSYPNFVTFRTSTGCSSSAGMVGGQQFVNLADGCTTGNTIHEIGHALGLWHEQSREDRDSFVRIHWENIQAGREHDFDQQISTTDDLGTYDYGSIMHFGAFEFSANGQPTIEVLTAGASIGQRDALSAGDIQSLSKLYPEPPFAGQNRFFTMDYDGDGDDDLVIRGPGGEFNAYTANGTSLSRTGDLLVRPGMADHWGWNMGHRYFVMDYDGDGDDDFVARDSYGTYFGLRSEGNALVHAGVLHHNPGMADPWGWNVGHRYFVMDYDGDGDDDLVTRDSYGTFSALRSEGNVLVGAGVLHHNPGMADSTGWNNGLRYFPMDYDGDGDDDLVTRDSYGTFSALRSERNVLVGAGVLYHSSNMADSKFWNNGNRYFVMDYDGDGDDDLVTRNAYGLFSALRSEGSILVAVRELYFSSSWGDQFGWNDADRFFVADFDRDGDDDLLMRDFTGTFYGLRSERTRLVWAGPLVSTTFVDP